MSHDEVRKNALFVSLVERRTVEVGRVTFFTHDSW